MVPVAIEPAPRGADHSAHRLTALVVSVAIMAAIIAVVYVAGTSYQAALAERTSRHPVTARLLQDAGPPRLVPGAPVAIRPLVPAQWTAPDGRPRTGLVITTPHQPAGTVVHIWTDDAGNPTWPPATTNEAATRAALQAGLAAVTCAVVIGLLGKATSAADRRRRYAAIDREWAQVEPGWSGPRG
jgi:hypothetical protein